MKKIVALVLCLALALSLCTVAFAAQAKWDAYDAEDETKVADVYYVKEDTKANVIGHYTDGSSAWYVKCAEKDADAFLVTAGTEEDDIRGAKKIWVKEVTTVNYDFKGSVAKLTVGEKCNNVDEDTFDKDDVFYSYVEDKETKYAFKGGSEEVKLLVNGEIVLAQKMYDNDFVSHDWEAKDMDDEENVLTVKCSKGCGTTAKVYKSENLVPADLKAENTVFGWIGYKDGKAVDSDNVESAETFDAGIAVYAGMALASVAGSAVVIGKKKEF